MWHPFFVVLPIPYLIPSSSISIPAPLTHLSIIHPFPAPPPNTKPPTYLYLLLTVTLTLPYHPSTPSLLSSTESKYRKDALLSTPETPLSGPVYDYNDSSVIIIGRLFQPLKPHLYLSIYLYISIFIYTQNITLPCLLISQWPVVPFRDEFFLPYIVNLTDISAMMNYPLRSSCSHQLWSDPLAPIQSVLYDMTQSNILFSLLFYPLNLILSDSIYSDHSNTIQSYWSILPDFFSSLRS